MMKFTWGAVAQWLEQDPANFLGRGPNVKCYLQSGHILQARKTPYTV